MRSRPFLEALPKAPEYFGYVPRDAQQRAEAYARNAGAAASWPIPLTYCRDRDRRRRTATKT